MISFKDIIAGVSLLGSLPSFLRHPIAADEARAVLRQRLENRESTFLQLVRTAIFQNRTSPYRQLLKVAGVEFNDIAGMVRKDGIEEALVQLLRAGVYLTVDELKVHHAAVRGNVTIPLSASLLRNPLLASQVWRASGRSATVIAVNLSHLREQCMNFRLFLEARGGRAWRHGIWTVPGATASRTLGMIALGLGPFRCFSQLDERTRGLHWRYAWSERMIRYIGYCMLQAVPRSIHVPLSRPTPIIEWMRSVIDAGEIPHLWTSVSSAVRLCLSAKEKGIELRGAQFSVSGEPLTGPRLKVLESAGAHAASGYGSTEIGWISGGCLAARSVGEQHLFHDRVAIVQPANEVTDMPRQALLATSLQPSAPMILLNVSLGDEAVLEHRHCGCEMEAFGWGTYLHSIRSYEKLTAAGMSFLDRDLETTLEVTLPERFGGAPTDYQLVEEDGPNGLPRLILRVAPSVGPIDEARVKEHFLNSAGKGSGRERLTVLLWQDSNLLRVERKAPKPRSGKILHLDVRR